MTGLLERVSPVAAFPSQGSMMFHSCHLAQRVNHGQSIDCDAHANTKASINMASVLSALARLLPQMGRVPSASSQVSATGADSRVRNVSYQALPEVVQTLMAGSESGLGATFGTQTDVGRDQASASHGKKCGPCSLQAGAGDVLNYSGRRRPTDSRHKGNRADFAVDPTNLGAGKVTGGSYLQLHLIHSGGKKSSATRWH